MSININSLPPKPIMPSDTKDDKAMFKYQQDMTDYNRILTMMTQMQSEEAATHSNMDKSRHDAVMSIVNNIK